MREILVDMRNWTPIEEGYYGEDEWADCPQRAEIEAAILDLAPHVAKVTITKANLALSLPLRKPPETKERSEE